uniref:Chromosome partition protein n=1 Tax=Siphoviridae sp. ctGz830 TaxID=2827825 RepID=A0A8S5TB35_9CAUD|nr:MAG TPA: chromosome partition protein [Siphoviridae sp. ctGz830]
MNIKINSLRLQNFKGVKELEINFKDKLTNIYGDNAVGKTTVFDAFCWLLWDKDSLNRSQFEIKTLDENGQAIPMIDHSVEAILSIDGVDTTFKKIYSEIWTKKRGQTQKEFNGHTTDYYINDVPIKKKEYQDRIASVISEEQFKLLSNVQHFNVNLDKKQRRDTLLSLIDDVNVDEIISSNEDFKKLEFDKYKLEEIRAMNKATASKINKEIEELPVRIDELNNSIQELDFDALEFRKKSKSSSKDIIDKQLSDFSSIADNISRISRDITSLELEKNSILRQIEDDYNKKVQEKEQHQNNHDGEKLRIKRKIANIEEENRTLTKEIELFNKNLDDERAKWIKLNEEKFDGDTTCPTCKQELPAEQIDEIKAEFNINKSKKLEQIELQAKHLKDKIGLKEKAIEDNNKIIMELEFEFTELNREDIEIEDAEIKKDPVPEKVAEIDAEIEKKKKELANLNKADNKDLLERKKAIESEIEEINKLLYYKDENVKIQAKIEQYKEQEKELAKAYEKTQDILNLCDEYTKVYTGLVSDKINDMFKLVKFKLFDVQINGGITETCEATVDGVPYSDVNNAGKINAGLDIIKVLSEKLNIYTPIFIDNAESVNELMEVNAQVVRLVVSNDKKLRVE